MKDKELQALKKRYGIVGNSPELVHALDTAIQVAKTDMSVLILGESGVGKDILPRIIHDNSTRKSKKYIAVNCGSIPQGTIDSELFGHEKGSFTGAVGEHDGYFAAADGGTLFLDEVGEMPMATQARLLRVLETGDYMRVGSSEARKTNVRIVAATNVNIARAIREGRFREDLYYRLGAIPVKMPPLRDRADDIALLFKMFALETAEKYNMPEPVMLTDEATARLTAYAWPGNIRQLKNVTEKLSVLLKDSRLVTPAVLDTLVPEINETHQMVAMGNEEKAPHNYEIEREVIFKMLIDLHNEVNELKQHANGNSGKKALPKKDGWDEAVEI